MTRSREIGSDLVVDCVDVGGFERGGIHMLSVEREERKEWFSEAGGKREERE